eukprot:TRINITY_DN7627_c0_g1_i1.p1 TRINITY_DN7627_c0_g1~~TRINITY_DN7627_c0_g1_i1.p1  ORF type:complete len:494 (-),score=33.95 TRINITY_DN7627_c0_g1_i1:256-1737(-)
MIGSLCPNVRCLQSLKFECEETEAAFVKLQRSELFRNSITCFACITLFSSCLSGVLFYALRNSAGNLHVEFTKLHLAALTINVALLTIGMLGLCAIRRNARSLELAVVILMIYEILAIFSIDKYYVAVALGYSPDEVSFQKHVFSDTRVLLSLKAMVTFTHLCLPIRWYVLLPIQAMAPVTYLTFVSTIGSPEGLMNAFINFIMVSIITMFCSMGKRRIEITQRKDFANIISEKSLRFRAEHQLSRNVERSAEEQPAVRRQDVVSASSATFDLSVSSLGLSSAPITFLDQSTQTSMSSVGLSSAPKTFLDQSTQTSSTGPAQNKPRPPLPPDWPRDSSGRPMPPLAVSAAARQQQKALNRRRRRSAPSRSDASGSQTREPRCVLQTEGPCTLSQFECTSTTAVHLLISKALYHVNPCGRGCCPYHLGIATLRCALEDMDAMRCDLIFSPHNGWQCSSCNAMNDLPDDADDVEECECDVCWHTQSTAPSPLASL